MLDGSGSLAVGSGNDLTLTVSLSFNQAFAGTKNLHLYSMNGARLESGWQISEPGTSLSNASRSTQGQVPPCILKTGATFRSTSPTAATERKPSVARTLPGGDLWRVARGLASQMPLAGWSASASRRQQTSTYQKKGIPYVDVHELACNATECPILDEDGQYLFSDEWHRSLPGDARFAGRVRRNRVFERILGGR